jgi:hypothetical protein
MQMMAKLFEPLADRVDLSPDARKLVRETTPASKAATYATGSVADTKA